VFILFHTLFVKQKPDFAGSGLDFQSANAGQLLAAGQVQNPPRANGAFEEHVRCGFAGHVPDQCRPRHLGLDPRFGRGCGFISPPVGAPTRHQKIIFGGVRKPGAAASKLQAGITANKNN
jgi:hypothetical protein